MSPTPQELRQELRQRALDARARAATNVKALLSAANSASQNEQALFVKPPSSELFATL